MNLKVLLLVSVASMIGVETTSFIAVIGAAGLAIGLALQGSLATFAGGVLIMLFRPFRAGDWIEGQGVSGSVDSIHIFHTTLKTADNKVVIVPNGSLSNGNITNYSREPKRRADINLGIDYSSDIKKARDVLLKIAEDPRIHLDPAPVVFVTGLGDSAVNLSLRVWVATPDFWPVTFGFTELAKERLTEAGIGIPFPQRVVHLVQSS
jgi:small conductance mechanosensitive channel